MRNLKIVLAIASALIWLAPAIAQTSNITGNTFQTGQPGKTVTGFVGMCVNGSNQAVPCGSGGTGAAVTVTNINPNGQTAMAASTPVVIASDQTPIPVVGNVADGVSDTGASVKIGGLVNTTSPSAATTGQRLPWWLGTRGSGAMFITSQSGSFVQTLAGLPAGTQISSATTAAYAQAFPAYYAGGSAYDPAFTCPLTAQVTITAGSTTEIVALTASQLVRVCSFSVSMSAAGTFKFLYGTGTNCGTGPVDLTPAMPLGTATPWTMSAPTNSVLRSISANALCGAAVTGIATVFVNYIKF